MPSNQLQAKTWRCTNTVPFPLLWGQQTKLVGAFLKSQGATLEPGGVHHPGRKLPGVGLNIFYLQ
jgi:hypothetical protein